MSTTSATSTTTTQPPEFTPEQIQALRRIAMAEAMSRVGSR